MRSGLSWLLLLAGIAGCAALPRYVRGDLEARAAAPIAADARLALLPAPVPTAIGTAIASRIATALELGSRAPVALADADVLVGYRYSDLGQPALAAVSDGLERRTRKLSLLDCPGRFSQRLVIVAVRGADGRAGDTLWKAELCSDGGGDPPEAHVDAFAAELMRGFGMNRGRKRFEFLITRRARSSAAALPPSPAAERSPAAAQSSTSAAVAPTAGVPATNASDPAPPEPVDPEAAAPGPTWADATGPCERLDEQPGVACSIVVEDDGTRPVLHVAYLGAASDAIDATAESTAIEAAFCRVAGQHGLLDRARARITSSGESEERGCSRVAE